MVYDYRHLSPESIAGETEAGIAECERLLSVIAAIKSPGTFAQVLAPLDQIMARVAQINAQAAFPAEVSSDEAVRTAARAAQERLGGWLVSLSERDEVNEAILAYAAGPEAATLAEPEARFLDDQRYGVQISGYGLPVAARAELRTIRDRLVECEIAFSKNIAGAQDPIIAQEGECVGLPDDLVETFAPGPQAGTYILPLEEPVVVSILEHGRVRALRERAWRAWKNRAVQENTPILTETIALRHREAALLGRPSWAHLQLERQMAATPEAVESFYAEMLPGLLRLGRAQMDRLADLLGADLSAADPSTTGSDAPDAAPMIADQAASGQGAGRKTGSGQADETRPAIEGWDVAYYDARLREAEYGIETETVRAYFPLEDCLAGFFELTGTLFGISFAPLPSVGAWAPEVRRYEVLNASSGGRLGVFDLDLHPRPDKFTHAASFALRPTGRTAEDERVEPYSALLANLPAPRGGAPSLLAFAEVRTLFHELGHILHQMLSQASLASQAGTSVRRDFVEAPSQIMENFLREPAILARFARHWQTGEPIPAALAAALGAAANLNVDIFALLQAYYGRYDLAIHGPDPVDIFERHRALWADTLRAYPEGVFEPANIGHFFGYDAGYYGYLWSAVRGDDMWSRFREAGVLDAGVGAAYRRLILEPGDSRDPGELLREFLGREPTSAEFLRLRGLE